MMGIGKTVEPTKPPECVVSAKTETGMPRRVLLFSAAWSSLTSRTQVAASLEHCRPPTPPFLIEALIASPPTPPTYLRNDQTERGFLCANSPAITLT